MPLSDITNVSISLSTASPSGASFNEALILAEHEVFTERLRHYTSLDGLTTDGFLTTDEVYKAAEKLLSRTPRTTRFAVGRADAVGTNDLTWAAALDAIVLYDNAWYGVILCERTPADVAAVAAWTETQDKIFVTASAVANVVDVAKAADTATIAYTLQNAGYLRTKLMYHDDAGTTYPEATFLADLLGREPGSYQMEYKSLPGVDKMTLTPTQQANARAKNVLIYQDIGGFGLTLYSKVAGGEWIDVIVFRDWLKSRIETRQFALQLNNQRVPYNNDGISQVESELRGALVEGSTSPHDGLDSFTITTVDAADVDAATRGTRIFSGISFTGKLKNAIIVTNISGNITN
jgi:hypothetical protein